jgi:hypothetical protein
MPHLPISTAAALFTFALLAGVGSANATSTIPLNGATSLTVPVVREGGGDDRVDAGYRQNFGYNYGQYDGLEPGPVSNGYEPNGGGGDEVRGLQEEFPQTRPRGTDNQF